MRCQRRSTVAQIPDDHVGEVAAAVVIEILEEATVELLYVPDGTPVPDPETGTAVASSVGPGPDGWQIRFTVRLGGRLAPLVLASDTPLLEILSALPGAALRAAHRFRAHRSVAPVPLTPPMRRALRDTVIIEALGHHPQSVGGTAATGLIAEIVEFLVEFSGVRVESRDLTHGVVVTDAVTGPPRLRFAYPDDLRAAKRGPLLFDGQRSVLLVDREGRARTELQRHRLDRLPSRSKPSTNRRSDVFVESGALVAEVTRRHGGIGFFLRADRTIWVFVDGQPLVMRRGEHWTAFPLELAAAIGNVIGGGPAADIVVQAAFIISSQRRGAILAIVDKASDIDGIVAPKDRYDLRDEVDPTAMRIETRLHHLIDADELDELTLARLAGLDGATILDRDAHLLAYGAIVSSADSEFEGARTAAAKTLSHSAAVVLKVSEDGDLTVFQDGRPVATLLGSGSAS